MWLPSSERQKTRSRAKAHTGGRPHSARWQSAYRRRRVRHKSPCGGADSAKSTGDPIQNRGNAPSGPVRQGFVSRHDTPRVREKELALETHICCHTKHVMIANACRLLSGDTVRDSATPRKLSSDLRKHRSDRREHVFASC